MMQSQEELSVYLGLYEIVERKLRSTNNLFQYKANTFLCDVMSHPQNVCVSKYLELSNSDFAEAIYVRVMNYLPDEKIIAKWEKKSGEQKELFQKEVLKYIARSNVVAINHIRLIDNPYFKQRKGLKYYILGKFYGLTNKSNLRQFGKKLPHFLQKLIRKVFL